MNPVTFALLLLVGLVVWYCYYGIECALNGGMGGLGMPFRCLMDDIRWNLPFSGPRAKAEWVRRDLAYGGDGAYCSESGSWQYQEIRDSIAGKPGSILDLDYKVGKAMLPGRIHFAITHVFLPFGPAMCYFLGTRGT